MKHERTSYAFLMEMIWVCAFFLICASIFVTAFAKAEQLSRKADTLNQAVQAVSNLVEDCLAEVEDGDAGDVTALASKYTTDEISIGMYPRFEDGLYIISVSAFDPEDGEIIYSLTASRAVPEGGSS